MREEYKVDSKIMEQTFLKVGGVHWDANFRSVDFTSKTERDLFKTPYIGKLRNHLIDVAPVVKSHLKQQMVNMVKQISTNKIDTLRLVRGLIFERKYIINNEQKWSKSILIECQYDLRYGVRRLDDLIDFFRVEPDHAPIMLNEPMFGNCLENLKALKGWHFNTSRWWKVDTDIKGVVVRMCTEDKRIDRYAMRSDDNKPLEHQIKGYTKGTYKSPILILN